MSSGQIAHHLKEARRAFETAMVAREQGRGEVARHSLLLAADALLKAAQHSNEPLRSSRIALAESLIDEAKAIPQSSVPYSSSATRLVVSDSKEETSWLVTERPAVRFSDVAGLEEVKEQICIKLLYPFTHPELAKQYGVQPGGGILLYGPPGTGKTLIARAVAGEIDAAFFTIKPSEIMSQWVGVAEQNLEKLFKQANAFPVSVIFIDEMESLAPKRRTSRSTVMQRVVPQLLAELDGFHKRENALLFIGATNEPWAIDAAILRPGRLDRLIYVPPPDWAARRCILELNLEGAPLGPEVSLEQIATRTQGFSGADMASLARRVREKVFSAAIHSGQPQPITMVDFDAVMAEMKPSIPEKDLRKFEQFARGELQ